MTYPLVADSTWAIVTLAGAVLTIVGIVVGGLLRNSRSSPEVRDSQTKGWDLLTGKLTSEVERVSRQVSELLQADINKSQRIAALESQVAGLQGVNSWLRRYVQKLLDFIRANAMEPPAPDDAEPLIPNTPVPPPTPPIGQGPPPQDPPQPVQ